ncbi:unnamed protein product, partial [Effrenium voratum]
MPRMPRALRGRPTRPTPKAKCSTAAGRFGRFAQLDSGLGCRSSQLQLLLYRFARAARDRDVKPADLVALGTRRFRPRQFFRALDTLLEVQAPLSSLTSMVRQKRYTEVLLQHPLFLITALGRIRTDIRKPEGEYSGASFLGSVAQFLQQIACLLAERTSSFGNAALPLFVALASSGGRTSFRRLGDEQLEKLIQSVTGTDLETVRLSANEAADMFCALHRVSYRNPALMFKLTRHICDHVELLAAAQLPKVARVLGRGDVHEEYVLLHAIARRVGAAAEVPEGSAGHLENAQAAALLVNVCSKWEIFDEEFLTVAAAALRAGTAQLAVGQICEVIYSVSAFLTRDAMPLEDFCSELKQRIHEMNEIDTVRLLRGLQKLRYHDEALMEAVATIILEAKARLQPISLCNLVSVLAYFGTSDELVMALLKTAIANKLPAMSVQHILTALCRLQGRVSGERLEVQVRKLCAHISSCSFTPVQAMSSLAAMAKLQHRDLAVASVLASILSGGQSYWRWAKSPHFFRSVAVKVPFKQQRCRRLLEGMESSHCVDILQSLSSLELSSRLTVHLTSILCSILAPQLHELRAKEVLVVARAFSAERMPDACFHRDAWLWRERALDLCLQSLRRHESFLDSSWASLLPLKLLCLQVNTGTFGTRPLNQFLSPTLFSFVERLRCLTEDECEANRLRREGEDDEENEAPATLEEPEIFQGPIYRILLGATLQSFPVDILLEARHTRMQT